jgi:hypothetical protein
MYAFHLSHEKNTNLLLGFLSKKIKEFESFAVKVIYKRTIFIILVVVK